MSNTHLFQKIRASLEELQESEQRYVDTICELKEQLAASTERVSAVEKELISMERRFKSDYRKLQDENARLRAVLELADTFLKATCGSSGAHDKPLDAELRAAITRCRQVPTVELSEDDLKFGSGSALRRKGGRALWRG